LSRGRLLEHRRLWAAKPVLARVYVPWFESLLAVAPPRARVLEVGAGPGFLAEFARATRPDLAWVASDLVAVPWNDVAADAARLPLREESVDAVVGLDVLHHLAGPAAFFAEVSRVLRPRGRLALVEPWITPLAFLVYRFFHQEECRLGVDPWRPFPDPGKEGFDGNAALPWRIERDTTAEAWRRLGFQPPQVWRRNGFAYLLSLGFRRASLLPGPLVRPLLAVDRATAPLAPLLALRATLVWQRR